MAFPAPVRNHATNAPRVRIGSAGASVDGGERRAMWVKICGVRDAATAARVAAARPDAIGLNFFPRSSRYVTPDVARTIAQALPAEIAPVGVFVNSTPQAAAEIVQSCGLQAAQFHGDESPADLAAFQRLCPAARLIRAWRMASTGLAALATWLDECRALGVSLSACLIDAYVPGAYGGTGVAVNWRRLREEYDAAQWPPLILAGGLTADNVAEAVRAARPWGVDVASGVETAPGVKDFAAVEAFIANARRAE